VTGIPLGAPGLVERAATDASAAPSRALVERLALPVVLLLALASSVTSLTNGFAYDDNWIITTNDRVHSLANWWRFFGQSYWPPAYNEALYRPFAILAFALQWAVGDGRPWPFHLVNVVLYAATCAAFWRFTRLFVPALPAFVVAALFAVHPVHVEATGNVVGQSEMWVALLFLGAMTLYLRWRAEGALSWRRIGVLAALYLASCLFKEHGVVLIALLGALELTVVRDERPLRTRLAALRPLYLALLAVAVAFVYARSLVLRGFGGDNPHPVWVEIDTGARLLTVVGSLVPEWTRLMLWPARLMADYSPLDIAVHRAFGPMVLPGVAILLGFGVLLALAWRRLPVAAFGLLVVAVTLAPVSNVIFRSGVMLAERTLFLPTLGLLLAAGAALPALLPHLGRTRVLSLACGATFALLLAAGAWRSAERQRTWTSTREVFLTMVTDAPLNFRAQFGWGAELFALGLNRQAEQRYRLAMQLYPHYHGVHFDLASRYKAADMHAQAVPLYEEVLRIAPARADARAMLVYSLLKVGRYAEARDHAIRGVRDGESMVVFRILLARAYRGLRDPAAGARVLEGIGDVGPGRSTPAGAPPPAATP
jgi:protein O-mannosyl-transferase